MGCGAFFPKGNFFFLGGALGLGLGPALATMVLTTLSQLFYFGILNLTCASSAYSYSVRILTAIKKVVI